jgi:ParB-like chromosome segregation protein Spo0J
LEHTLTLKTADIKPYKNNNRTHSDLQISRIAESIKEFGFNQPIVVDESNTILVGHGRLLAAQALGLDVVPVVQLKGLKASQKRAYRILDNKLQNDSDWDFSALESEIRALEAEGFDLDKWGLDELKSFESIEAKEFDESVADGLYMEAIFKVKLPVADAASFEERLDDLLRAFPEAKKEKSF